MLLTAIEFSSVATALPTIVQDLKGEQFIWVGSAYTLGQTALVPFCGGLAQIFGRRIVILGALALFCLGSALCGAATSMNFLIGGRVVQGLGAGAITSLVQIIMGDLVPLKERGSFNGIMAVVWSIGGGTGPAIGGSLAQNGHWRWLFYMNLPLSCLAAVLVLIFLRLKKPDISLREKLARIDWIGTCIVVASITSVVIALTWAGVQHPWSSSRVLAPLILGLLGLCGFFVYEAWVPESPLVPISMILNRTSLSGYAQVFLNGVCNAAAANWLPVYFQASKDASPTGSGVDSFPTSFTISVSALIAGIVVQRTLRYRELMWGGWLLTILGFALFGILGENTSLSTAIGLQFIYAVGLGIIYVGAYFPVLAPIPVSQNTPSLAFCTFTRNFSFIWGVTIGGTILQNQLLNRLPASFLAELPGGTHTQIAFQIIPSIRNLPQPLKDEVRHAFAGSLRILWNVLTGISGLGLLVGFLMKHLPLHTSVDVEWGRRS